MNYRVDASVAARLLPPPFRPRLIRGVAMAGICLIRLKQIRPTFLPIAAGIGSENAAHRFAVEWDCDGHPRHGVFVPRRDSSSRLNTWLGGRLVPGEHHPARFTVHESPDRLHVAYASTDEQVRVRVTARTATDLPPGSIFASLEEASHFFEGGALGYSATRDPGRYDALELRCDRWSVQPLAVDSVQSTFFDDVTNFPDGSAAFDCALLMRDIRHEWHAHEDLTVARRGS